jgi:hypothetical protein
LVIAADIATTDDDDDDDDVDDDEVVEEDNDDDKWIFREEGGGRRKAVAHPPPPGKASSNDTNIATKTMWIMVCKTTGSPMICSGFHTYDDDECEMSESSFRVVRGEIPTKQTRCDLFFQVTILFVSLVDVVSRSDCFFTSKPSVRFRGR